MPGVVLQVLLAWLVIFLPLGAAWCLLWWFDRAAAPSSADRDRPAE